ncbi:histidinol-phosphatase HisJ family protein [archaeon]|jgi:histidinol-phosphatase (PHP family)|nr:histidinol-phosphatase HisJ family protein [archaeon]MBT7128425.1 histidinol-phosphatase HisJ family protein [archaeon]
MVRVNCHVHSTESDGELEPREIVEMAVDEGLTHICFTDHFRMPKDVNDYRDERKHLDSYYEELNLLRREFFGKVKVLIGVELDWLEGYEKWFVEELGDRNYDFVLGSVHWLRDATGRMNRPHFPKGGLEVFGGERAFIELYLKEIRKMIEFGLIDCVAHLDVFRERLEGNEVLDNDWYREEVLDLLKLMESKGIALEFNCAGWGILGEQFPQRWIIEKAVDMGIGVTVGNDFHKLKHGSLDMGIDQAFEMLREIGCSEVLVFRGRKSEGLRI